MDSTDKNLKYEFFGEKSTLYWRVAIFTWFFSNFLNNYRIIKNAQENDWPLKYLTNWTELLNLTYSCFSLLAYFLNSIQTISNHLQSTSLRASIIVTILYFTVDQPKFKYIDINKHLLQSIVLIADEFLTNAESEDLAITDSLIFLATYLTFNFFYSSRHGIVYEALDWKSSPRRSFALSSAVLVIVLPVVCLGIKFCHRNFKGRLDHSYSRISVELR